jgi:hypothetical protein
MHLFSLIVLSALYHLLRRSAVGKKKSNPKPVPLAIEIALFTPFLCPLGQFLLRHPDHLADHRSADLAADFASFLRR